MKCKQLLAGAMALAMLCSGCSGKGSEGTPVDAGEAYARLAQEMTAWDGSDNLSTAVTGELFSEYANMPAAVRISGQYMQQEGTKGTEVYATQNYNYGDGYFHQLDMLGDGSSFAMRTRDGSEDPEAEVEPLIYGEYVSQDIFEANTAFGIPALVFDESQIESAAETTKENGDLVITFTLKPDSSGAGVIALMEALNSIDTEVVPVDADVSSMSCSATYQDDRLLSLSYRFSADLTAEGEVMETDYLFTHLLMANGDAVSFGMPTVETLVTQ